MIKSFTLGLFTGALLLAVAWHWYWSTYRLPESTYKIIQSQTSPDQEYKAKIVKESNPEQGDLFTVQAVPTGEKRPPQYLGTVLYSSDKPVSIAWENTENLDIVLRRGYVHDYSSIWPGDSVPKNETYPTIFINLAFQ